MRSGLPILLLAGLVAFAPYARAEDPPTVDILEALGLEAEREVSGVGSGKSLPCKVVDARRARMYDVGQRVILHGWEKGTFRLVPDAPGLTACAVGFTVHVVDFFPPAMALRALGLAPSDEPIPKDEIRSTKVTRVDPLVALGLTPDGIGDLVSVRNAGGGEWSLNTFGKTPSLARIDVTPLFGMRSVIGETLEEATVVLRIETLPYGGRLIAKAADPEKLAALGIPEMPAGHPVLIEKKAGTSMLLTTLSPGFRRRVEVAGTDLAALGLDTVRLYDLPVAGKVQGHVVRAWKVAKLGLKRARPKDEVEIENVRNAGYVLRSLETRRPGEVPLAN